MHEKMTQEEFIAKIEDEGLDYAFRHYGLSAHDLQDDVNDEFITVVEDFEDFVNESNEAYEKLCSYL